MAGGEQRPDLILELIIEAVFVAFSRRGEVRRAGRAELRLDAAQLNLITQIKRTDRNGRMGRVAAEANGPGTTRQRDQRAPPRIKTDVSGS